MTPYVDTNLIHNSSLSCFLLVNFIKQYEEVATDQRHVELFKLLLVLPFAWHENSRKAIKSKTIQTTFKTMLAGAPLAKVDLKRRVSAHSGVTLQGLNFAASTGLIAKSEIDGSVHFNSTFDRWPRGSKPVNLPSEMTKTTKRLAMWFSEFETADLYRILFEEKK